MQDTTPENKLRLLMIYASVYPEKFEGDKGSKLMQVVLKPNLCSLAEKLFSNLDSLKFGLIIFGNKS